MIKNYIISVFFGLIAMTSMAAYSAAQTVAQASSEAIADSAMPRLALPVAREDYPVESFVANEEGHVVLVATIDVDGQMSNARLEASSGYSGLDEAAIELANNSRLPTPPTNAVGDPVRVDVLVDVIWELPEPATVAQGNSPQTGAGGLQQDPSSDFAVALFRPGVDFSRYNKFTIDGPEIAFRPGWRRQHSRATLNDMDRIKRERAEWFRDVVTATLEEDGGEEERGQENRGQENRSMQLVDEPGDDVLVIRAGIGDLDVAAPFLSSETEPGYSIAAGGMAATLVLELFDSSNGEVLARLFDPQTYSGANFETPSTRYSNERDARIIFRGWAEMLRARLDEDRKF